MQTRPNSSLNSLSCSLSCSGGPGSVWSADNTAAPRSSRRHDVEAFPLLLTVHGSTTSADAYNRSMLLQGHGLPLYCPYGKMPSTIEHIRSGIRIGDVGRIDNYGAFIFYFNIFCSADDPVQRLLPHEFHPFEPNLEPSEVLSIPNFFKPGTIITSAGVKATKHSTEPLSVTFKSTKREGATLILPEGAHREDLKSTDRLHEYIHRNAVHWYKLITSYSDSPVQPNGSLIVVTGHDKAKDYAIASFTGKVDSFQYLQRPNHDPPWDIRHVADAHWYDPPYQLPSDIDIPLDNPPTNLSVFIRSLRVSLSDQFWGRFMPLFPRQTHFVTFLSHERTLAQRIVDSMLIRQGKTYSEVNGISWLFSLRKLQLFQPNIIIAQIALSKLPQADICLINDCTWTPSVGGHATLDNILLLVEEVFNKFNIVEKQGVITLEPKTSDSNETATRLSPSFKQIQKLFGITRAYPVQVKYAGRVRKIPSKPKKI